MLKQNAKLYFFPSAKKTKRKKECAYFISKLSDFDEINQIEIGLC